ncbi:hypothetical protein BDQ17DRAFT_1546123 [Cyathus striatus]|nr:hypothetical protein BDQ17DRAFT_1546123 [Cyathus striatus]
MPPRLDINTWVTSTSNTLQTPVPISPASDNTAFRTETHAIIVTAEFEKTVEECRKRVKRISRECRAKNRKFRDVEFDLEMDRDRCLHGLKTPAVYIPADVQRVTQIFEQPKFFIDGADSNDIIQGGIQNCWFLFCVARDEQVGIYGFVFLRDAHWVYVVIDDMLYTSIPKFDELSASEKKLYHNDKDTYNRSARRSGKGLYFARSGTHGETWVPLIEKAFAKLHGNYHALEMGNSCEAVEDMTGGVSSVIPTKDILDIDRFWNEELLRANEDRLFACSFHDLDNFRQGSNDPLTMDGLIGSHSYSVLRAVEAKGKRFVVIRNPWGESEWTGRWSDGSKEWTSEWLQVLGELGHVFGNDGQFVMEYKDFLDCWEVIERTKLFDSDWIMASHWLRVPARPLPSAWGYGDVSFSISIPSPSLSIIVLSELDNRYFRSHIGVFEWAFDFILFRRGDPEPIGESSPGEFHTRSVNLEMNLEPGDYVIHIRLDRRYSQEERREFTLLDARKESRVLTERAKSQSIATNFQIRDHAHHLPLPVELLAGRDLLQFEKDLRPFFHQEQLGRSATLRQSNMIRSTTPPMDDTTLSLSLSDDSDRGGGRSDDFNLNVDEGSDDIQFGVQPPSAVGSRRSGLPILDYAPSRRSSSSIRVERDDDNALFLGLRVYTKKESPANIASQLRSKNVSYSNVFAKKSFM